MFFRSRQVFELRVYNRISYSSLHIKILNLDYTNYPETTRPSFKIDGSAW